MPAIVQARVPQKGTLRKYGLTATEWLNILEEQGGVCAICHHIPDNGRLCVDHEHAKGWKKLPPEERRRWVRGLVCFFCNHYYLGRAINVFKARNVLTFLESFEERRPTCQSSKRKQKPKRSLSLNKPSSSLVKGGSNGQSSMKSGKIVKRVHCIKLDIELS